MSPRQINALLAQAALVDPRIAALLRDNDGDVPGTQAVRVATEWSHYFKDVPYEVAVAAMRNHYSTSTVSLLPAHLLEQVQLLRSVRAWDMPQLSPAEHQLCIDAGVPPEEFVDRRDEPGWVEHLKSKWQGIRS